jgi:putative transposase
MFDVTDLVESKHTMTKRHNRAEIIDVKALLEGDEDFLRSAVEALLQAVLEAEMSLAVGAEKSERNPARLAYRSGYYGRSLITRVGTLELTVPQDRQGRFSTRLFERYQRSEKALVGALAEMGACPRAPTRGCKGSRPARACPWT